MIRQLAILAVAAICLVASTSAVIDENDIPNAQKVIFHLLLDQYKTDKIDPEVYKRGQDWDFESKINSFDPEYQVVVRKFLDRYKLGVQPRGELFSIYYPRLLDEALLVFELFYHAPDLWTVIDTSVWASINLNEYQFVYALTVALVHRPDTKYIPIPPTYQIYPEFFFNSDFTKQLYDYKLSVAKSGDKAKENHTHVIVANYSNYYVTDGLDQEYKLAYFTEDIGFNDFYHYYTLRYPPWMPSTEYSSLSIGESGEIYYYGVKMMSNRYYLERLSHGLGDIEVLDWDQPILTGYSPSMSYPNGLHFPGRKEGSRVSVWNNEYLEKLKQFDSRVNEAIDSGYVMFENGTFKSIRNEWGLNAIAQIIQGNVESLNKKFYGSVDALGKLVLGFSPVPQNHNKILPGALEISITSMRDPGCWRLYKKNYNYLLRFKEHLGPYAPEELAFEGVEIKSVTVKKQLFTYFEWVDSLVDRFFYLNNERVAKIKARQYRLNNKPFAYNISIDSAKATKASIRIFLGPKYDVYGNEISDNYKNFFEIDYFVKDLTIGKNTIVRKSTDTPVFTTDIKTVETFDKIPEGLNQLFFEAQRFGFPARLLLPKGNAGGLPVQFIVYVSEFVVDPGQIEELLLGGRDNKPLGFPLDRPIFNYNMSNMYTVDTSIYHEDEIRINSTNE